MEKGFYGNNIITCCIIFSFLYFCEISNYLFPFVANFLANSTRWIEAAACLAQDLRVGVNMANIALFFLQATNEKDDFFLVLQPNYSVLFYILGGSRKLVVILFHSILFNFCFYINTKILSKTTTIATRRAVFRDGGDTTRDQSVQCFDQI